MPRHDLNDHAKFNIIEENKNESFSKSKTRSLSEHRDDFWILNFKLFFQDLNISLYYSQYTTGSIEDTVSMIQMYFTSQLP